MNRKLFFTLCLVLLSAAPGVAEDTGAGTANGPGVAVSSAASTTSVPDAAVPVPPGGAAASGAGDPAKLVRGMAVLGNNEAPMSLFIVPWKSSELGVEADLHRTLNERDAPVDRDVFLREVEFYQVSVGSKN